VEGSPLIAVNTNPPFSEYHFIDANPRRAEQLRSLIGDRDDVFIESADCNDVLIQKVFPRAKYSDYRRALCLLDPYNINLKWRLSRLPGSPDQSRFS
jgi:three-Cys-motif partner protein